MSIPIEQAAAPGHGVWIDALARNTTATARATPRRASDSQPRALGRSLASRQSRRFGSVRAIGAPTASRPGAMEATEDTHPVHSRFSREPLCVAGACSDPCKQYSARKPHGERAPRLPAATPD
jgi:hypothetical protein